MVNRKHIIQTMVITLFVSHAYFSTAVGDENAISDNTQACLECHRSIHPGIVADWGKSRMSKTTPATAKKTPENERRVSFDNAPEELMNVVVGCAECHTLNEEAHQDTFDHNDFKVHPVVTPKDCAVCHPAEADQYKDNLMANAHGNLMNNNLYTDLVQSVNGTQTFDKGKTVLQAHNADTNADSCLYCHGTRVEVKGAAERETDFGDMAFPVLTGWPNQGVGRFNPDNSKGTCTACHTRHRFSIEMARKPYTCAECHKGPDVPAYSVYSVSKHGNTFSAMGKEWDFESVPWTVGKDFTAPTCAACHVSLVTNSDGDVIVKRTHQMNDRKPWRIFGLIYAHPHPVSADTTIIKNKAGLPLPTELTGEPAVAYVIDAKEQKKRQKNMEALCLSCHHTEWVDGQFARVRNTIETTNTMTLTATKILLSAWDKGVAQGPAQNDSIFNETIEKKWVRQWLFYANSTRFASVMMGADYGVFAHGRWYMSENIREMSDWLDLRSMILEKEKEVHNGNK